MKQLPNPTNWQSFSWAPTIDGVILTGTSQDLARQGKLHKVPIMLGSSNDAGTAVATWCRTCHERVAMTLREQQYNNWAELNFPEPWASRILETYSLREFKPFWAVSHALTDFVYKCPTFRAAELLLKPANNVSLFLYNFAIDPVGSELRHDDPCSPGNQGTNLGSDLPFFLFTTKLLATDYEKDAARVLSHYIRNFAWSGDPNLFPPNTRKLQLPEWPLLHNLTRDKLWIGMPKDGNISVRRVASGLKCSLWNDYWNAGEPELKAALRNDVALEGLVYI
jgi:carboxylesterase type B